MSAALSLKDVSVDYGSFRALSRVTLSVAPGESAVLLGPNGAGKTTLCRAVLGLVAPVEGEVRLFGADLSAIRSDGRRVASIRATVGAQIEQPGLPLFAEPLGYLVHMGQLWGLSAAEARGRALRLLEEFELPRKSRGDRLSQGQRLRLQVARALLHEPRLLILDEPTATLDPEAQAALWERLTEWRRQTGAALLVCTHELQEAFVHAEHVAVLGGGKLRAWGAPREILRRFPPSQQLRIAADHRPVAAGDLENILSQAGLAARVGEGRRPAGDDTAQTYRLHTPAGETDHPAALRALVLAGIPVVSLGQDGESLLEVYAAALASEEPASGNGARRGADRETPALPSAPSPWRGLRAVLLFQLEGLRREPRLIIPFLAVQIFFLVSIWFGGYQTVTEAARFSLLALQGILPLGIASALSADAFAGERERRSLETLLCAPVPILHIFGGKYLSVFLPGILQGWTAQALVLLVLHLRDVHFPGWGVAVLLGLFTPAATALVTAASCFFSLRAKSVRSATQAGSLVLFALLILVFPAGPLFYATGALEPVLWAGLGLAMLVATALLLAGVARRARPETLAGG